MRFNSVLKIATDKNEIILHLMDAIRWEFEAYSKIESKAYKMISDLNDTVKDLRNTAIVEAMQGLKDINMK